MTDKQIAAYCDDVKETALKQFYKIQNQRKEISILHKKCVCQQREIETLKAEAEKYYNAAKIQQDVSMKRFFEIKRLTEENERLKKLLDDKCDMCIARERAEAVKEYKNKVENDIITLLGKSNCNTFIDCLEYIYKEMAGE